MLSCNLLKLLSLQVTAPHISLWPKCSLFHFHSDLIFFSRSRMAELSSVLAPVRPHLKCRIHNIHTHSLKLKTEMTGSIEKILCCPFYKKPLAYISSILLWWIKSNSFSASFCRTAIEILIPTTGFFPVSDQLSFGAKQPAIMHSKQSENPKGQGTFWSLTSYSHQYSCLHNLETSPQYGHGTGVIPWKRWP